jgi:hypothetical protein
MTMVKTQKTLKKTIEQPTLRWPFPVVDGERTWDSQSLIEASKALLRASVRIKRKRDACEDMPEALF